MKCEDVQLLLPDYDDGTLAPADMERVRAHLASCPACAREAEAQRRLAAAFRTSPPPQPTSRLPAMFHTWLEAEREAASFRAREPGDARPSWLRNLMGPGVSALAACVIFAAGLVIGTRALRTPPPTAAPDTSVAQLDEIRALRQELDTVSKTVAWSLLQQQSTSERLQTVRALDAAPSGPSAVNALLSILAYDSSANVRSEAVKALYRYAGEPAVPRALATALSRENSPVVQVDMIDVLAASRDPAAVNALASLAQSDGASFEVRTAASRALMRM